MSRSFWTCVRSSSLSPGAAACMCVCPDSWLHVCVGISPERTGCIHVGRLNRCALSGAGPPSGSFRARFEGAKCSGGASIILVCVSPASAAAAAAASMQVGVRSAWLPLDSSSDAEEGALSQDGLQLLHSLPGEAHLGGRSGLRRPLPGPLVLRSCSVRPGLIGSFRAPVAQRADGDDSRGLGR